MEILELLENSADELILEDLDFFETELATGDSYSEAYKNECKQKIKQLREWISNGKPDRETEGEDEKKSPIDPDGKSDSKQHKGIMLGFGDVVPDGDALKSVNLSPVQQVQSDIKIIRDLSDYKSEFKKYVKSSSIIDSDFIDKHYGIFRNYEINAIVEVKQLDENFLEKYFGAIDHKKIARYQQFSEGFFMKHFNQMDAETVLKRGKNDWRKKDKRSKQLDVFLRLKGVKI